jgi:hypothetical protein
MPDERQRKMQTSLMYGKYDRMIDRESAYEILSARMAKAMQVKEDALRKKEDDKFEKERVRQERADLLERNRMELQKKRERDQSLVGSLTKMAATRAKREAVNTVFKVGRGLLGSLLKGK